MIRNIALILQREYLSKVRKKSFWVMAIVGPVLLALGMIVPLWFGMEKENKKIIEVIDESGVIGTKLISTPEIIFVANSAMKREQVKEKNTFYATLTIPANIIEEHDGVTIYSHSRVSPEVKIYIENALSDIVYIEQLKKAGLDNVISTNPRPVVSVKNEMLSVMNGAEEGVAAKVVAGLFSCVLILFFIIIYGGQVMRGVMEEKMNRIVEVMISTVQPFELMMGKIVGIALVSLTQFLIWIILTYSVSFLIQTRYAAAIEAFSNQNIETTLKNNPQLNPAQALEMNELISAFDSLDITFTLVVFLIYFLFGYLLYAALFAGIGSLVDSESDTQQFVFPLIFPLMFVMIFATAIMEDPNGTMAFWLSMIPFTAPLTMMLRIPFGVPVIQLILSMILLVLAFLASTWISAKVYRTGILLYGKKITPLEIYRMMKGN